MFVDDSTLDFDSFEKCYEYILKVTKVMSGAGLELRKWETNLAEMLEKIYDGVKETVSDVCAEIEVLALAWETFRKTQLIYVLKNSFSRGSFWFTNDKEIDS